MSSQQVSSVDPVSSAGTWVQSVRFEHGDVTLGVGTGAPRLSWQVVTDDPDWAQTAYEVELDGSETVRVASAEQVLVPWPFEPLASRASASVRVRVASASGSGSAPGEWSWSAWSEPATVEVGLLRRQDWVARFITPRGIGEVGAPAPVLTREVELDQEHGSAMSARLYVTAHGVFEATMNGQRVGDDVLSPGWTSFSHRLAYRTYDVTSLLRAGSNEVAVLLGNGWYRGGPSTLRQSLFDDPVPMYGDRLALLAQLEVIYADGTVQVVGTDKRWSAYESRVVENDLYDGQRTDLRARKTVVHGVDVLDGGDGGGLGRLVAPAGPPVRVTEMVAAVKVFESASGKTLVDFGQNLVGWVRLRVRGGSAGDEVVLRHAEVLEDGELGVRQLQQAKATDSYILDGSAEVVLEPSLTFHGFRYAEISGVDEVGVQDVEAVVIGSDLRRTGWFSCSDPDLEQLHENVVWSTRGNFVHLPTDCPQRAERLGWTGDIQVFAPTACFLFDSAGFLDSWLADLAAEQYEDGSVPWVIPDIYFHDEPATAGWGDAATMVVWVLYQRYGDAALLARQFDSMRTWVDKVASLTTNGVWTGGFQWGDWLDPTAPPDTPAGAKADPNVVATAHLARSADIVADAARVLGRHSDAENYARLAQHTRDAFAREYVTAAGWVLSDAQTVYALALQWALLATETQREHAARRLADLVRINGFRIGTGFLGTPLMTDALTSIGHTDLAYRLLLEKSCPSWLYPVTMGATTIWERWDSMLPDGSVNPARMVSFNHYALGAVADWMHRTIAGLAPAAPGYRHIAVHPQPHYTLTHASARHLTPYGEASVAWHRANGQLSVDVEIPAGAQATVYLPGSEPVTVRHGQHCWTVPDPCDTGNDDVPIVTVRDLIDSPRWPKAVNILVEHNIGNNAADIAARTAPHLDQPALELPDCLCMATPGGGDGARRALEAVLDRPTVG